MVCSLVFFLDPDQIYATLQLHHLKQHLKTQNSLYFLRVVLDVM